MFARQVRVESRQVSFRVYDNNEKQDGLVLVLMHGLGATSLSFSCFIKSLPPQFRVIAFDSRGHGGTIADDGDDDLSSETLVADAHALIQQLLPQQTFILCGHSMGGAIATRLANEHFHKQCLALIVIEAIEGIALQSLERIEQQQQQEQTILLRPEAFRTVQDALAWSCSASGPLPGASFSASISIPDQLVPLETNNSSNNGWTWRTNMNKTLPYWRGWFENLSALFVQCAVKWKLLLVSSVEKLDGELTIGQMQGKFQLLLMPGSGHFLHEISPGQSASLVAKFIGQHVCDNDAAGIKHTGRGMSASEILALNHKRQQ